MEQGRNLSTAMIAVAALLPLLLCLSSISAVRGQDLFASLDFARESLLSFRNSSKPKPSDSSNQFFQAVSEVERAVALASANPRRPKFSQAKLKELAERIKRATNGRSYSYGRSILGEAIYLVEQQRLTSSGGRIKRATPILDELLKNIDPKVFKALMKVDPSSTLYFAIDDTGSMGAEINAVKDIAKEIVEYNYQKQKLVDYVLSPFNDPELTKSRAVYKDQYQRTEFVNEIDGLVANGGGDCPELAFEGMYRAVMIESDPPPFGYGQMYVFTDAYPKDVKDISTPGEQSKRKELTLRAIVDRIPINFFLIGSQCGRGSFKDFITLATETGGQIFQVSNAAELRKFSGLVKRSLNSESTLYHYKSSPILSGRKKRSLSAKTHSFNVDDSTEHLTIILTAERPAVIMLHDPSGTIVTSGKVSYSKAVVYEINDPLVGLWKLVVPNSAGNYEFRVKSTSSTNIDFQYCFLFTPPRSRQKEIPITQPISGETTQLLLTVAGAEKINPSSLSLELITDKDKVISTVKVTRKGSSAAHYLGTITTPSTPFQLKLKGSTKKGSKFERISNIIEPKSGVMRTYGATNDFTLGVGRPYQDSIMIQIYNAGSTTETFDLTVKDSLGYTINLVRKTVRVYQKRSGLAIVRLRATKPADIGKTESLFFTAKRRTPGLVLTHVVQLLVVDAKPAKRFTK